MNEDILLQIGSKSNPLVVNLHLYEGHRLVDIRRYFLEKATGSLKPTKKGINLNHDNFVDIRKLFQHKGDEIAKWLESGDDQTLQVVREAFRVRSEAEEREARRSRPYEQVSAHLRTAQFFKAESHGGNDKIEFNEDHAYLKSLDSGTSSSQAVRQALGVVLIAYYRAKLRFPGDIEMDSKMLFEMLEYEWGVILSNYCSKGAA